MHSQLWCCVLVGVARGPCSATAVSAAPQCMPAWAFGPPARHGPEDGALRALVGVYGWYAHCFSALYIAVSNWVGDCMGV
jgi:hypothetical protein